MSKLTDKIEESLEFGGLKKDLAFLIISATSLILSLSASDYFPFDPAWVAVFLCGIPIIIRAVIGLLTRFDIQADVLVSIALIASICIDEIFAAGEVAAIMMIGGILEEYTSEKAGREIEKLSEMRPKTARVIKDGEEKIISASDVKINDIVRVIAGESIPVDGIIISGTTTIDQSNMTGEPVPVDKSVGDDVMSGTVNQFGIFDMMATKVGEDSSIERMIRLVEEADADKSPIVRSADRWATWIVLISLTAAALTFLMTDEIIRAVTVLLVFCPCAFVLATPTAVVASIGNATRHGFLVRSGTAMEMLSKVDTVAFDKTGTITNGIPSVRVVKSISEYTDEDIYRICATAEKFSEHPLGKAMIRSYGKIPEDPERFEMIPGKGISCSVEGHDVLVGNYSLIKDRGSKMDVGIHDFVSSYFRKGDMMVFVSIDGRISGFVTLEDVIKDDCERTVSRIRELGIEPILMTGDNEYVAKRIANKAKISNVVPNCLPEHKLERIGKLQNHSHRVCMIGDGINDAPALKKADVGISMGGIGSDIAIEASDITLVNDDIRQIPHLLALSRRMMKVITVNLSVAMGLNIAATVLAAMGALGPVSGALVHNVGSVLVVINSIMLIRWRSKSIDGRNNQNHLNTKSPLSTS